MRTLKVNKLLCLWFFHISFSFYIIFLNQNKLTGKHYFLEQWTLSPIKITLTFSSQKLRTRCPRTNIKCLNKLQNNRNNLELWDSYIYTIYNTQELSNTLLKMLLWWYKSTWSKVPDMDLMALNSYISRVDR